jgi:basic amino acid/polyamine antiporter, APA family
MSLNKKLGFYSVFCIATGAMISSGLFILPAIVFPSVGPALLLAYVFGSILMIPAMLSKTELATAMPKSGGTYFFIHRSLGSLFGTFAGFASWFSLCLKSAFALLGIGLFLQPLFPGSSVELVKAIAIGFTILFTIINIFGVKESGSFQTILVFFLIGILLFYVFSNVSHVDVTHYKPFKPSGWDQVLKVTGLIFISFGGLTKIASIAEEIKNPSENIPKGMFAAFIVVSFLYVFVIFVTIGILSGSEFVNTTNPISLGASKHYGNVGFWALSIAAMLAFITTGNAGLLASSRIPLAMSKDDLLPSFFSKINLKFQTPVISTLLTSVFMILSIALLDLENLVKVASTMMLILFFLVNLSVILMRESKIVSYRPSYKSPFYPYIQIFGMAAYFLLIIEMGFTPLILTLVFFTFSLIWFFMYSKSRNKKQSALYNLVEKIISKKIITPTLSDELKDILYERDEIIEDKFDKLIKKSKIIEMGDECKREKLFEKISDVYAKKFKIPSEKIYNLFMEREDKFSTAIHDGLALPHIIIEGENKFDIVIARSKKGIKFDDNTPPVHIVFALVGTMDERTLHLQTLMAIAQIIQNKNFIKHWKKVDSIYDLRSLILLAERVRKGKV